MDELWRILWLQVKQELAMLLKKFPHSMLEFGHNDTWFTKVQPEMMMSTTILGLNFRWLSIRELGENPLGLKC